MTAATKKVMLFVVEGPSDETAFALLFDRVFSEHLVKFDVTHCDMTTARSFAQAGRHESEPNAYERLRGQIIEHIKRSPYEWSDLQQIVQIVDTDGAFVPDDCVVQSEGGALVYGYDKIEAPDRDQICRRNKRKKEALSKLCGKRLFTYEKKNVPYAVYYLSRNMEHVLHNRADEVSDRERSCCLERFDDAIRMIWLVFKTFSARAIFPKKAIVPKRGGRFDKERVHLNAGQIFT